jgi:hypothetical protein
MAVKCVTCGLLFRTNNELEWHIREEHMQRAAPRPDATAEREPDATAEREPDATAEREPDATAEREPDATAEREPDATAEEPPGRPRWLSAARRLFGRRPPESPSG